MRIEETIVLPVDRESAWEFLTNLEWVAGCMPGAEVEGVRGEKYEGHVAVRIGPVNARYVGSAEFVERDKSRFFASIEGMGRDKRGQGTAKVSIDAHLEDLENGSKVSIVAVLELTGRIAQYGRGLIEDIARDLFSEFATCLGESLAEHPAEGSDVEGGEGWAPSKSSESVEPGIDVLRLLSRTRAFRAVLVSFVVIIVLTLIRRGHRRASS